VEREGEEQGAGQGGEQQVDGDEREVGVACGGEGQPPREDVADRGRRVRLVGREVDPLQREGEVRRVPGRREVAPRRHAQSGREERHERHDEEQARA
jgi:hypothetical protein